MKIKNKYSRAKILGHENLYTLINMPIHEISMKAYLLLLSLKMQE